MCLQDEYYGRIASIPTLPLLGLNGNLDQATTYAYAVNYTRTVDKDLVTFPEACHCTIANSPVKAVGALPCASEIIVSFFKSHGKTWDGTCLHELDTLDLGGGRESTKKLAVEKFGTSLLWGNPVGSVTL